VESDTDTDTVREIYERAIANTPPIQEKRHWRRYIYLWINYSLYEELEVKVGPSSIFILPQKGIQEIISVFSAAQLEPFELKR